MGPAYGRCVGESRNQSRNHPLVAWASVLWQHSGRAARRARRIPMKLVEGKVAIVTGSGRGIGRAVAELFAAHGARVVVNDLQEAVADEAVAAIRAKGGDAIGIAGSITDPKFPDQLVKAAVDRFGALDVIVNNAGYTHDGVIHKMSDEQWYAMI